MRTAEKLLRDFYPRSDWGQTQLRLLQSLCLLATRDKANVEAALGTFIAMAQAEVGRLAGWAAGGPAGVGGPSAPTPASRPCAEGQRPRPAGHGAGPRAAEAGPQGAHAAEASGQGPVDAGRGRGPGEELAPPG